LWRACLLALWRACRRFGGRASSRFGGAAADLTEIPRFVEENLSE